MTYSSTTKYVPHFFEVARLNYLSQLGNQHEFSKMRFGKLEMIKDS